MEITRYRTLGIYSVCLKVANEPVEIVEANHGAVVMIRSMAKADVMIKLMTTQKHDPLNYWPMYANEVFKFSVRKRRDENAKVKIFAICNDPDQWVAVTIIDVDGSFLGFSQ